MDLGLGGRGYLLTGASRGLGFAAARALVDDGARVVLSSRSQESVDRAVKELGGPPTAFGAVADLGDAAAVEQLVGEAREQLGRLDGALVSVGGPPPGAIFETTPEQWRAAYDSVLLGPLGLIRALVPHLGEGAAIGLVLSTTVRQPRQDLAISGALRPGLDGCGYSAMPAYAIGLPGAMAVDGTSATLCRRQWHIGHVDAGGPG